MKRIKKTKLREIIDRNGLKHSIGDNNDFWRFYRNDFDKLEKELTEYIDKNYKRIKTLKEVEKEYKEWLKKYKTWLKQQPIDELYPDEIKSTEGMKRKDIQDVIEETMAEFYQEYLREPNLILLGTKAYNELSDKCISSLYDKITTTTYNGTRILVMYGMENKDLIICGFNIIKKF